MVCCQGTNLWLPATIMKICFGLSVLLLTLVALLPARAQGPSAAIQATATVAQPVGLIDAQQAGDMLAFPIIAEYSSRWFLYLPKQSNVLVQLDGEAMAQQSGNVDGVISFLDLTEAAAARADRCMTVTLIYSEN